MPPRMYDYDQILRTYDELQNMSEVSHRLNVPWRTIYNVVNERNVLPYTRKTVPPEMVKQIIETYKRLKNMNAVAKELKITRQLSQNIIKQYSGICKGCGCTIKPGEINCEECKKKSAVRVKNIRKERHRLGLCQDCDKPYDPPSRVYCTEHRLKHQEIAARMPSANKQRTREKGSPVDIKARLQGILKSYGENGVRRFQESDARCFICRRQHGEECQIHIHHINCNEKDHSFDNLICLCFEHHMAVHSILRGPSVPTFLSWMQSTYVTKK